MDVEFNRIAVGNQEFLCYDVMEKRLQMEKGRIVIITGSPGTGKTTAASVIAKESSLSRSVHIHNDDFYHYLSKGAIPPYLPESNEQNKVVMEAVFSAAESFAHNGYDVIVDGIIGPWFIGPLAKSCRGWLRSTLHYITGGERRDSETGGGSLKIRHRYKHRIGGNHVEAIL